jgi:hypothetical protein
MQSTDWRRLKKVEKKHEQLPRRRFEDVQPLERIWLYYFDMNYEIVLTKGEEETRQILEMADELILRYYPGYGISTIAAKLVKDIARKLDKEVGHRQCINYVNQAMNIFGEPIDVDKEKKRQLYIKRFNNMAIKAEEEGDFNAATRALTKAAELENFNKDGDESIKDLIKNMKAKEIVFSSNIEDLKKQASDLMNQSAEDADYEETE